MNKQQLNQLKAKALTNDEISELLNGHVKVMTYSELKKYHHIDELLEPYGCAIILYQTKKNFGHWIALIKQGPHIIEHFDSYGIKPDNELKFVKSYMRSELGQDYPHLTYLLYHCDYQLSYNQYRLQKFKKNISTCGRWCVTRCILRNVPLDEFVKLFKIKGYTPDDVVTLLTYENSGI
jgi:hypothetical protein